jgi:hypothetical protein
MTRFQSSMSKLCSQSTQFIFLRSPLLSMSEHNPIIQNKLIAQFPAVFPRYPVLLCPHHGGSTLNIPEMAKEMTPRSGNSKPKIVLLTNQHISSLILRESYLEAIPFQGCVTISAPSILAWSPIAARSQEIGAKYDSLFVRNHLLAALTGRPPSPPLDWFSGDAKVHA